MNKEKYIPTPEEVKDAENMMAEEKKTSETGPENKVDIKECFKQINEILAKHNLEIRGDVDFGDKIYVKGQRAHMGYAGHVSIHGVWLIKPYISEDLIDDMKKINQKLFEEK